MKVRGMLTALKYAGLIGAVLAATAGPATAQVPLPTSPFAVASTTPPSGGSVPYASRPTFSINVPAPLPLGSEVFVEVATQPTLGQDGTLASEFNVDMFTLQQGDAYPTTYTGTAALSQWTLAPGTYYWQAYYYGVIPGAGAGTFTTPVYTVNVDKPPLSLTLSQANSDVPVAIKDHTGVPPHRLFRKCKRRSQASFACQVGWSTTNRLFPSTVVYAGTMTLNDAGLGDDGNSYFNYRFRGIRVTERCVRRHSIKACARTVRW